MGDTGLEPVTSSVSCEYPSPVRLLKRREKPAFLARPLSPTLSPFTSTITGYSVNFRHDAEAEFFAQPVEYVERQSARSAHEAGQESLRAPDPP